MNDLTTQSQETDAGKQMLDRIGGAEGDRTPDLMTASHALSQLSYGPKLSFSLADDSDSVKLSCMRALSRCRPSPGFGPIIEAGEFFIIYDQRIQVFIWKII